MALQRLNHISVFTYEAHGLKYIRHLKPLLLQAEELDDTFYHLRKENSEKSWIFAGQKHPFYRFVNIAHEMEMEDLEEMKNLVNAYLKESVASSDDAEKLVVAILAVFVAIHMKRDARRNPRDQNHHKLLLYAASICQQYDIQEPKYIEFVLKFRLMQLNNSREWFEFLSPTGRMVDLRDSILYQIGPEKIDQPHSRDTWITDQHLKAMEYYLRFARHVRVTALCQAHNVPVKMLQNFKIRRNDPVKEREPYQFNIVVDYINLPIYTRIDGINNVTPLTWACQQSSPKAVKLLLRYGATPIHLFDNLNRPHRNLVQPLYALGNSLNARVHQYLEIQDEMDEVSVKSWERKDIERTVSMIECLRYILRAEPYLPVQFKCEFRDSSDTMKHVEKSYFNGICLDKRLKQLLPIKLTEKAPSLEAVSRYTIRNVLMGRQLLPDGINQLPLPNLLKEYLDLQRD